MGIENFNPEEHIPENENEKDETPKIPEDLTEDQAEKLRAELERLGVPIKKHD